MEENVKKFYDSKPIKFLYIVGLIIAFAAGFNYGPPLNSIDLTVRLVYILILFWIFLSDDILGKKTKYIIGTISSIIICFTSGIIYGFASFVLLLVFLILILPKIKSKN